MFMYGHAAYTASKYAVRGLAESVRCELLPYSNMRVTLMCPGFVNMPFLDERKHFFLVTKSGRAQSVILIDDTYVDLFSLSACSLTPCHFEWQLTIKERLQRCCNYKPYCL
ncbi:hypothetical protein GOP47_0019180 [Adiantum capillus-veneris]|uniref:Uncharacterized protein n=1 Tax=Adiantum capillus-veneris TaxID=13818 RepID=A0A9D4UFY5_ADICA|nr:hypothetical protein GOP47_0019180 [Adiantum capillus-veneris]